jgi:hypothetical protein
MVDEHQRITSSNSSMWTYVEAFQENSGMYSTRKVLF